MEKPGGERVPGSGRKLAGAILYALTALGVILAVLVMQAIRDNHRRNAATGDFTGASLATAFLLVMVLPLTLAAFLLALWLAPPWKRAAASRGDAPTVPESAGRGGPWAPVFVVAGVGCVGVTAWMLAGALSSAHRYYGQRGFGLVQLALQDLILFSPLLALAGVFFWLATRRRR